MANRGTIASSFRFGLALGSVSRFVRTGKETSNRPMVDDIRGRERHLSVLSGVTEEEKRRPRDNNKQFIDSVKEHDPKARGVPVW